MRRFGLLFTALLLLNQFVWSQTRTITGIVTDDQGKPLQGVHIIAVNSTPATVTDSAGRYSISVRPAEKALRFSYVGFDTREVRLKTGNLLNVTMTATSLSMQEVVVVGYSGVQRALSGSVAGISVSSGTKRRHKPGYNRNADFNTEEYDRIVENAFHKVGEDPLSTFSIDVDAASYSSVRRYLNEGRLPPADAVRVEEMINYFRYDYQQPKNGDPFSVHTEISGCPWNKDHKLVMIGLQGKQIPMENLPPSNIVFLIDVSGSMNDPMKLPLVQSSMKLLTDQLREKDRVSIVVYAGAAGLVLPATTGADKRTIKDAIDKLEAGGSTAGGEGIKLAYKIARENFIESGNNRIVLCTDGDFNVGVSSNGELERMVEQERESGVFLTVLGYGMGNYKDSKMQILADKGNGNHAYIDSENEAKKVLVSEFGGTLFTIAKDVKLQVEFNPSRVAGYRLIGYENRMLDKEDFKDDKKDAGDMGSGHTVTALYEVIPAGVESKFLRDVDPLKYQKKGKETKAANGEEMFTVKFRYKQPDGHKSQVFERAVIDRATAFEHASENLRFSAAVAEFGMLLRQSEFRSAASFEHVLKTATAASSFDREGYRKEFIQLVQRAETLQRSGKDLTKQ